MKQSQSDTRVEKSQADQENQRILMFLELRELRSSGASRMYQKLRTKIFEAGREWHENRSICT